jgi:hypothetical protein
MQSSWSLTQQAYTLRVSLFRHLPKPAVIQLTRNRQGSKESEEMLRDTACSLWIRRSVHR